MNKNFLKSSESAEHQLPAFCLEVYQEIAGKPAQISAEFNANARNIYQDPNGSNHIYRTVLLAVDNPEDKNDLLFILFKDEHNTMGIKSDPFMDTMLGQDAQAPLSNRTKDTVKKRIQGCLSALTPA